MLLLFCFILYHIKEDISVSFETLDKEYLRDAAKEDVKVSRMNDHNVYVHKCHLLSSISAAGLVENDCLCLGHASREHCNQVQIWGLM